MLITQARIWKSKKGIIGLFYLPGVGPIFTYELHWKNNKNYISCIPAGYYHCVQGRSTKNRKWGKAFYIQNVPKRKRVIFGHIGNGQKDSHGCTLFGLYYIRAGRIGASVSAINLWMNRLQGIHEFDLLIIDDPVITFLSESDSSIMNPMRYLF